ncbi:MAG: hypothetical protein KKA79_04590 [Nanoarchaeota archaeon]|nr:hypothetical protein [Nanoarchaeota archaeon]MCG2718954.1 hypothetical protein [Nanoarchaeota archaeon]
MAEEQPSKEPTPQVVTAAQKQSSPVKFIFTIVLILVLVVLIVYGVAWAGSDAGGLKLAELRVAADKYNPFTFYGEQLKKASEVGSVWQTESSTAEEKIGVKFDDFTIIGNKIVPAGSTLAFKYKFDVGEGVQELPLKLECSVKDEDVETSDSIEKLSIIPPEPKVSTDNPLSYSNIVCQMKTKKELSEEKELDVQGKVSFKHENQRGSLRVYFTDDTINMGEDFFDKYGIDEDLPIRSIYNQEPVELGLGVSDENIQPIIIGENYFPAVGISLRNRWDGKVTKITSMSLSLPKEISINKEDSPASTLCPFGETTSSTGEYKSYSADIAMLNQLPAFGKGIGTKEPLETSVRFFCWLKIDDAILGGSPYQQDQYSVSVSYDYEFQAKTVPVKIKPMQTTETTTTTETTEEETTQKSYSCLEKETQNYVCLSECDTTRCEGTCGEYDSLSDCQADVIE